MARARPPISRTVTLPSEHPGTLIAYRFSNGREFNDPGYTRGIYAGVHPGDAILQEGGLGEIWQEDSHHAILQE